MNPILVPVNFNDNYQNLLDYAISMAARSGASLTLLYNGGHRALVESAQKESSSSVYHTDLEGKLRNNKLGLEIQRIVDLLKASEVKFAMKFVSGNFSRRIIKECRNHTYQLLMLGADDSPGWRGYLQNTMARRVMSLVQLPVFVVPVHNRFNEIDHITYAVDLSDYDPAVIQQVKQIAYLLDAKLTIVHVNQETEKSTDYLETLEQTITDTIDYPKVYYKFFDHADIFAGLKKFVAHNNSKLVAMTSRSELTWRDFVSPRSLTQRMAQDLKVPLLAFRKL